MDRCSRWFYSGDALACEIPPPPALKRADSTGPFSPRIWEKCPVCGGFVAQHPEWIAQLVYDDGLALFFDGAKDLFRFLLSPQRLMTDPDLVPIVGIFVTGYRDHLVIDARGAFFVIGSNVMGPRGSELVAHGSAADARKFSRDHGGTKVREFAQVDANLLSGLV